MRAFGTIVGAAAFALFVWLVGAQFGHWLWSLVRATALPLLIAVVIAVLIMLLMHQVPEAGVGLGIVGGILAFALSAGIVNWYVIPHNLSQKTEAQEAEDLDFRARVPFDVARSVSNSNMGDTTGDSTGRIKALPAEGEHGEYTTAVVRRGVFKGYESSQTMTPPLFGSTTIQNVEFCDFSEDATLRFGGMVPSNNLKRAIMWRTSPSTKVDPDDALIRCEDGVPMVYAPLTKLDGHVFLPQRVPGGVAIYNGHTGELTIEDEIDTDLPLYPQSIAERQRESLTRSGSIWDALFRRSGYEDTSKDEQDPNGENRSEFVLADSAAENQYYVTPLTQRGSTTSIIALGTVKSDGEIQSGELRPYQIHTFKSDEIRQSNSAVSERITGGVLRGWQASGLTVFEIVPSENGTWTATVGKDQEVVYRAVINVDGSVDLQEAGGEPIDSDSEGLDLGSEKPIEDMTTEELQQLGDQILEELADRAERE